MTKNDIIKFISSASGAYSPYQIFRDWVECLALAIANTSDMFHDKVWDEREDNYLKIISKYDQKTQLIFAKMTAALIEVYEDGFDDVLGDIYMKSGCGNKNTGQFFTPYHISVVLAECALLEPDTDGLYHINEPTTGGGANIIAAADVLKKRGVNYQKTMRVIAQDLDWLAVYMTYIACSLYGINAIVVQGNTLTEPYVNGYDKRRVLRTPQNLGVVF